MSVTSDAATGDEGFDPVGAVTFGSYRLAALAARALARCDDTGAVAGARLRRQRRQRRPARHDRRATCVAPTRRCAGLRLRRAVQEAFDSYARYWLESFRLPYLHRIGGRPGHAHGRLRATSRTGSRKGNGVILALPHLGGWEWAGRWLADLGHGSRSWSSGSTRPSCSSGSPTCAASWA